MRRVTYSLYLMPARPGHKRPHVSNWKMNPEEAAGVGALSIVPGSTEIREIPETEEERRRAQFDYQSAGRDGAKPPAKQPA